MSVNTHLAGGLDRHAAHATKHKKGLIAAAGPPHSRRHKKPRHEPNIVAQPAIPNNCQLTIGCRSVCT
jgi:hypothetical protein